VATPIQITRGSGVRGELLKVKPIAKLRPKRTEKTGGGGGERRKGQGGVGAKSSW